MKNTLRETSVAAMKSLLAFILAVCMVMTALPEVAVAATSSGYYIRPGTELTLTLSSGSKTVKVNSSHVLEMVSKDKVTVSGTQYEVYQVYYGGEKYNVPASTVNASCIKPVAEVDGYAMSTLWKKASADLPSLKKANNLTADMNTYAMQLALKTLGYLSDAPDGGFGDVTDAAVKKYQKDAGLQQDGVAGPQTLTALYKAALKKVEGVTQYVITTNTIRLKGTSIDVPAGKVMKMVQNYADASNPAYYIVSYKGYTDCRVLISDVQTKAVIVTDLDSYIVKNVWTTNTFTSLKESENIKNDLHVHAAQYALTYLGYSTETTHDGSYGTKTVEAVKKFQAATGNVVDGVAGAVTLKALYAAALAKWNTANATPTPTPKPTATPTPKPTTTTTSSATATPTPTPTSSIATTGTLRTLTKVNLRETRSTNGLRLGSVPEGTTLTYYDARVESSGTWYKVIYKNNTGWLLGTFVTTDLTSGSTSNLLPNGSIRTTSKVNMRKETTTNSFRLGSVPENTILYYSDTAVVNGITWYKVSYSGETGWIMGTYTSIYTTNTTTTTNTLLPTGSVRTTAKVNIRETASTGAKRLGSVPENVILSYLDTSIVSGVTWYKITYKGETGWIMGTYTSNYYAGGTTTSTGTSSPTAGTLKTTSKVNLRKKASTTATRLDQVPAGVNLSYTTTTVVNGVTWYYVTYNGESGWLMGTFVTAKGSSTSPAIGTVTITKGGTHVRDAANGNKTGVNLSKGTTVDLIASPVTSGGYTWYNIRTSSGVVGFVRGDCASISSNTGTSGGTGSSTNTTVYSNKLFLYAGTGSIFFKTTTKPATGYKTLSSDAILMLAADTTYTKDGKEYVSVYYKNEVYNAEYVETDDFFIMDTTELSYALETAFETELGETLKQSMDLVGDFRVYALQLGLQTLGLYTGNLDGSYGAGTTSAVRNLQRQTGLKVDGECGKNTWNALAARIGYININGGGTIAPSTPAGTFGAVTSVQKLYWDFDNDCTAEFPKYSYATVMDVETKKVFTVYRWAGANHADCVPATEADTKIMCEIAGFTYNSSRPSSSQKSLIIGDDANNNTNYTWPDFRGSFGGSGLSNKSDWDRRPVLVNIGGKVYPASIFGWPHGYLGENKGVGAMTLGGKDSCCDYNNYYGMMCIHFYNSTTHGGTSGASSGHLAAVNKAWDYAKSVWPTLVK